MAVMRLAAFLVSVAALIDIGETGLKIDSIACMNGAVAGEFTEHVKPQASDAKPDAARVFVEHHYDPPMYFLKVNWGSALLALESKAVEGGILSARKGDPACLNEAARKCLATLLEAFIPAAALEGEETSIGKSWGELVKAMLSATGVKDDCSLDNSARPPTAPVDGAKLRTTTVQCIGRLAKEILRIRNEKTDTVKLSEGDAVRVFYAAERKGRWYHVSLGRRDEKNAQLPLFKGHTNSNVPLVPTKYTDRACEDLAIMRCANQMLHHHAKPKAFPNEKSYKGETGKTLTEFLAALTLDNTFQCK